MRRFNPLCALLVRCVVVAGVRWMLNTSARYCYRCCFPQHLRMKGVAASGQFHAPIRCVVVAVVRWMLNTSARYCYRCCPLHRTEGARTPSFLTTTTLSAPAFGRIFKSTYLCRSLPVPSRPSVCPPRMCVVADTSRQLRMRRRAPSYGADETSWGTSLPRNQANRPGRPAPQLPYPPYNR